MEVCSKTTMSAPLRQTLLAIKTKIFKRALVSEQEMSILHESLKDDQLACRVIAADCVNRLGGVASAEIGLAELRRCASRVEDSDKDAFRSLAEAALWLPKSVQQDPIFRDFLIRALTHGDRPCKGNAKSILTIFAKQGDQLAQDALNRAANDPDILFIEKMESEQQGSR